VQVYYTSQSHSEEDQPERNVYIKRQRFMKSIMITCTELTTATRKIGRALSLALPYPSGVSLKGWGLKLAWIVWSGLYEIARLGKWVTSIVARRISR